LVVLQAVARPLDLDHAVAALLGPELDQIRHPGAVVADVLQQAQEALLQVRGRQASQCLFEQGFAEHRPEHERRLQAVLGGVAVENGLAVATLVEPPQAAVEQRTAPLLKVAVVQVLWRGLKRVEKKHRVPARKSPPSTTGRTSC